MKLRNYQEQGLEEIRNHFRKGAKAVLYQCATGSGKSVLMAFMAKAAAEKGIKVCFVVHRDYLIQQLSDTLNFVGVPHGIISPGFGKTFDLVQIASSLTLIRRFEIYKNFGLLIYDEAHRTLSATNLKIAKQYPSAKIVGLTATPQRLDGQALGDVYEQLVVGPSMQELTRQGFLVPYSYYAPQNDLDLSGVKSRYGDFIQKEAEQRVNKPTITGDAISHYKKICPNARAIVFCHSIEHAKHVCESFNLAGVASTHIDGTTPKQDRKIIIEKFKRGQIKVLTNVELVTEGFDLPAVEAVIQLRATQSLVLFLQAVGRALRPSEGKKEAIILDHVGNLHRHGLPDENREWSLEGRAKTEKTISITSCPSCYLAHRPAPKCPHCGFEYRVTAEAAGAERVLQFREGELKKLTAEDRLALQQKRKQEQRACQTLEELVELGRSRGYKFPVQWAERLWGYKQKYKKRVA